MKWLPIKVGDINWRLESRIMENTCKFHASVDQPEVFLICVQEQRNKNLINNFYMSSLLMLRKGRICAERDHHRKIPISTDFRL